MKMKCCITLALSYCLCIGGLTAQDITSTFLAGSEDWLVVDLPDLGPYYIVRDGPFAPVFLESEGNPGGHISFEDPSQCCSYFFDALPRFPRRPERQLWSSSIVRSPHVG